MIQGLEQVECRCGMPESGMKPDDLPVKTWRGTKIPAEVRRSVADERAIKLADNSLRAQYLTSMIEE